MGAKPDKELNEARLRASVRRTSFLVIGTPVRLEDRPESAFCTQVREADRALREAKRRS